MQITSILILLLFVHGVSSNCGNTLKLSDVTQSGSVKITGSTLSCQLYFVGVPQTKLQLEFREIQNLSSIYFIDWLTESTRVCHECSGFYVHGHNILTVYVFLKATPDSGIIIYYSTADITWSIPFELSPSNEVQRLSVTLNDNRLMTAHTILHGLWNCSSHGFLKIESENPEFVLKLKYRGPIFNLSFGTEIEVNAGTLLLYESQSGNGSYGHALVKYTQAASGESTSNRTSSETPLAISVPNLYIMESDENGICSVVSNAVFVRNISKCRVYLEAHEDHWIVLRFTNVKGPLEIILYRSSDEIKPMITLTRSEIPTIYRFLGNQLQVSFRSEIPNDQSWEVKMIVEQEAVSDNIYRETKDSDQMEIIHFSASIHPE